jgi:predicted  nucleic acid-binding Zn-ribbon protein
MATIHNNVSTAVGKEGQIPSFSRNPYIEFKQVHQTESLEESIPLTYDHSKDLMSQNSMLGLSALASAQARNRRENSTSWRPPAIPTPMPDYTDELIRAQAAKSPNSQLPPRPQQQQLPSYYQLPRLESNDSSAYATRSISAAPVRRTPKRENDPLPPYPSALDTQKKRDEFDISMEQHYGLPVSIGDKDRLKIETDLLKANGIPTSGKSGQGSSYSFGVGFTTVGTAASAQQALGSIGIDNLPLGLTAQIDGLKGEYDAKLQGLLTDMRAIEKVQEAKGPCERETRLSQNVMMHSEGSISKENEILREFQFGFDQNINKMIAELRKHFEAKIAKLTEEVVRVNNENQTLRSRCVDLVAFARQIRSDLTMKSVTVILELERLSKVASDRSTEIDTVKKTNDGQIKLLNEKISQSNVEIDQLMKTVAQGDNLRMKLEAEISALEAELIQLRSVNKENEAQIEVLTQQNTNLSQSIREKMDEKEALHNKIVEIERLSFEEMENLRQQLEALKKTNLNARELSLKYGVEKANYERERSQYFQMLEDNKMELTKMSELFHGLKSENEKLKGDLECVRQQVFTLSNAKNLLETDKMRQNDVLAQLRQELSTAVAARDSYKLDLEKNREELARKNHELIKKIQEYDAGRKTPGMTPTSPYNYHSTTNTSYRETVRPIPRAFGNDNGNDSLRPGQPGQSGVAMFLGGGDDDDYKKRLPPPQRRDHTPPLRPEYSYCTPIPANTRVINPAGDDQ